MTDNNTPLSDIMLNLKQQTVETTTPNLTPYLLRETLDSSLGPTTLGNLHLRPSIAQDDRPSELRAVTLEVLIEERIQEIQAKLSEISKQQEDVLESVRNLNKLQLQVSTELNHLYNLNVMRGSKG